MGRHAGGGGVGGVHVELITYLQLLAVHGGQSCHVVGEEVGGAHVHLGICSWVVGPHGQALMSKNYTALRAGKRHITI